MGMAWSTSKLELNTRSLRSSQLATNTCACEEHARDNYNIVEASQSKFQLNTSQLLNLVRFDVAVHILRLDDKYNIQ